MSASMVSFAKKCVFVIIMQSIGNTLYTASSSLDDSVITSKPKQAIKKEEINYQFNHFFKCGGNETTRRNTIEQRVLEYLVAGGTPNLCNEFGTNLLHMVSYYGHEATVTLLVEQYQSNVMTFDRLGCLPGDYARKALVTGIHPFSAIQDTLTTRETIAFEQRRIGFGKEDLAPARLLALRSFMDAFNGTCAATFVGNQAQHSRKVTLPPSTLSAIFNFLGNVVPLPGASIVAGVAAVGIDTMEDDQAEHRRNQYFSNVPRELSREFMKLAYVLSQRYEMAILELSEEGAHEFGKYCADKVEEYLSKDNSYIRGINKKQSFVNQVLEYLRGLPKEMGVNVIGMGSPTSIRHQRGGTWGAKEILTESNLEIPITLWPLPLTHTLAVTEEGFVDQAERTRLESLLSNLQFQDVDSLSVDPLTISSTSSLSPSITSSIDQSLMAVPGAVAYMDSAYVEGDNEDGIEITPSGGPTSFPINTSGTIYSNSAHVKGNNKGGIKLGKR